MQSYKMQDVRIHLGFERQMELNEVASELKYMSR